MIYLLNLRLYKQRNVNKYIFKIKKTEADYKLLRRAKFFSLASRISGGNSATARRRFNPSEAS